MKHGHAGRGAKRSPEYTAYHAMKARCLNERHRFYPNYGGRGITICARWLGKDGFVNWLEDLGPRPSLQHTVDREHHDDNYCPEKCRWADVLVQNNNTSRNKYVEIYGERLTLAQAARKFGKRPYKAIIARIYAGWPADTAVLRA